MGPLLSTKQPYSNVYITLISWINPFLYAKFVSKKIERPLLLLSRETSYAIGFYKTWPILDFFFFTFHIEIFFFSFQEISNENHFRKKRKTYWESTWWEEKVMHEEFGKEDIPKWESFVSIYSLISILPNIPSSFYLINFFWEN